MVKAVAVVLIAQLKQQIHKANISLMRYNKQQSQKDQIKHCEGFIIFLWWPKDVGLQ